MSGIRKYAPVVLSLVLLANIFTACDNAKDKVQNSGSKDGFASNRSSEKNNSNQEDVKNNKADEKSDDKAENEKADEEYGVKYIVETEERPYIDMGYINSNVKPEAEEKKKFTVLTSPYKAKKDENVDKKCEYQVIDKNHITVKVGDKWRVFQDAGISAWVIPNCVAHFEAEIMEGNKERLLIKIINLPKEFGYIFGNKKTEDIKPVQVMLNVKDIFRDIKRIKEKELKGKRIKLWFDGEIKGDDVKLSNPIELGKIYSSSVLEEAKNSGSEEKHGRYIQVDNYIYMYTGYIMENVKCGTADGEIRTTVDSDQFPEKDDESNFGTGYRYQIYDKGIIIVQIDNKWHIFHNMLSSSVRIPEGAVRYEE